MKKLLLLLLTVTLTYITYSQPGRGRIPKRQGSFGNHSPAQISIDTRGPIQMKMILNGEPVNYYPAKSLSFAVRPGRHHMVLIIKGPGRYHQRIRKTFFVRRGSIRSFEVKFHRRIGWVFKEVDPFHHRYRRGRYYDERFNW